MIFQTNWFCFFSRKKKKKRNQQRPVNSHFDRWKLVQLNRLRGVNYKWQLLNSDVMLWINYMKRAEIQSSIEFVEYILWLILWFLMWCFFSFFFFFFFFFSIVKRVYRVLLTCLWCCSRSPIVNVCAVCVYQVIVSHKECICSCYLSAIHRIWIHLITCSRLRNIQLHGDFVVDVVAIAVIVHATTLFFTYSLLLFKPIKYENHLTQSVHIQTSTNSTKLNKKIQKEFSLLQ